jgi:KDO2-lipid IV(A) lauroyltransferase
MALARLLPRRTAYRLGDTLAAKTATRLDIPLVRAVRANQAVVRGFDYRDPALTAHVKEVLAHAARSYTDLFRAIPKGPQALIESCRLEPSLADGLRAGEASGRGLIAVSAHLSCFDMLLLTLVARGIRIQALSYANPRGSYLTQNDLRRRFGLEITPISAPTLRLAVRRLRDGGMALTGVDRPIPDGEMLEFFGRKARLPVGHARLAIRTNSLILVGAVQSAGDASYRAVGGELVDPAAMGEDGRDPVCVAQRVITAIERFVLERPQEWLMFFPVWPEVLQAGPHP